MTHIYKTCTEKKEQQKPFSPVSCFSSYLTILPLGYASICSKKMATPGEKSFFVLEYHTSKSVVICNAHFVQSTQRTSLRDLTDLNPCFCRAAYNFLLENGYLSLGKICLYPKFGSYLQPTYRQSFRPSICYSVHIEQAKNGKRVLIRLTYLAATGQLSRCSNQAVGSWWMNKESPFC